MSSDSFVDLTCLSSGLTATMSWTCRHHSADSNSLEWEGSCKFINIVVSCVFLVIFLKEASQDMSAFLLFLKITTDVSDDQSKLCRFLSMRSIVLLGKQSVTRE